MYSGKDVLTTSAIVANVSNICIMIAYEVEDTSFKSDELKSLFLLTLLVKHNIPVEVYKKFTEYIIAIKGVKNEKN